MSWKAGTGESFDTNTRIDLDLGLSAIPDQLSTVLDSPFPLLDAYRWLDSYRERCSINVIKK